MADDKAFTSTPDATLGNPVAITTVTNAAAQTVDQQIVSLGDPTDGTLHAAITVSGLAVQPGPVVVSGTVVVSVGNFPASQPISGTVTVTQATAANLNATVAQGSAGASAWVVNISTMAALVTGAATVGQVGLVTGAAVIGVLGTGSATIGAVVNVTGSATLGQIALTTGSAVIGVLGTGSATLGQIALVTGAAVIGALATGTATLGMIQLVTGAAVIGSMAVTVTGTATIVLATAAATIGAVTIATGAAVIGALTANQSVTIAATANVVLGTAAATIVQVFLATAAATIGQVVLATGGATTIIGVEPKDTGRTAICLLLVSVTGTATEALGTMTIVKGLVTITAATTYTVTTGKTFRMQSVHVGGHLTTATNEGFCRVNVHTAAVVTVASPTAISIETGTAETGTLVANSAFFPTHLAIPDGLEVAATNQVGISHVANATTLVLTTTVVGYEY